jgi:hypothetical protein
MEEGINSKMIRVISDNSKLTAMSQYDLIRAEFIRCEAQGRYAKWVMQTGKP